MPIQGLRDTTNFVAEQRPKNWRETILLLYPNGKAPLTALTSLMKTKSTDDPEFAWWEKLKPSQRLTLTASITNVQTTLTVGGGGARGLSINHILRMEHTGELVLVTAAPVSDTAVGSISRGFAGTAATAITLGAGVNPNFHVVATAFQEGSPAPAGINYDPTKRFNYTEIFRNTLEMTRTASKTRLRTGDAVKEAKREALELHSCEMEKAFILGTKVETTFGGKPQRATGGVISFIDSGNIVDVPSATLNLSLLEDYMRRIFDYGSTEKLAFCGNRALLIIQQVIRKNSTYQLMQGEKEYGMNVSKLISPFGTLVLKSHPLFNEISSDMASPYYAMDAWLLVVDQQELVYRPFDDTTYQKDLQTNGLDSMSSGYLTEAGLEIHHPKAHFLLRNVAISAVG